MSLKPISLACEILFSKIRPESIWAPLKNNWIFSPEKEKKAPNAFLDAAHHHGKLSHHSEEEKIHLFLRAALEADKPFENAATLNGPKGIFRILLKVVDKYLFDGPNGPELKYDKMLVWRMLSSSMGQDLPVCAFLAFKDVLAGREREDFSWPLHLKSNNYALRQRLEKGMAENHYHLWGSIPSFHLTWLRLMGSVQQHERILKAPLEERLDPDHFTREGEPNLSIEMLSRFTALLRIYLFLKMEPDEKLWESEIEQLDAMINETMQQKGEMTSAWHANLDAIIASVNQTLGMKFAHGIVADYALYHRPGYHNLNNGVLLVGERTFLYRSYKRIIREKWTDKEAWLFYLYILSKAKIRREYVQLNERIGFYNFKIYQDRKKDFILGGRDAYSKFLDTWNARFSLSRPLEEMPIVSLEARIGPKDSVAEYTKDIRKLIQNATKPLPEMIPVLPQAEKLNVPIGNSECDEENTPEQDKFYFVVHFIKEEDKLGKGMRNAKHRKKLSKQAHALRDFRRIDPKWAQYIKGIDAASTEIGCRPEVFAHIFRFLRRDFSLKSSIPLRLNQIQLQQLRLTFHVGEDFLDIIDGLRAIDETMRFLEYRRGDRLGHALALGVNAKLWYKAKMGTVMLPLQDLVDNLAWMHSKLTDIADPRFLGLVNRLAEDWHKHFQHLIKTMPSEEKARLEKTNIADYALAWELRGDDPSRYKDPMQDPVRQSPTGTFTDAWTQTGLRIKNLSKKKNRIDLDQIRSREGLRRLYHVFQYAEELKKTGAQIVHYDTDREYIAAAKRLQQYIHNQVKATGVGIEANPTSNYLIGTFRRYDRHPIPTLYNLGLSLDQEKVDTCPQLSVSINTDDLGVFDTNLENEFALMSYALEKMKKKDGTPRYNHAMIMDWLDRIRETGLQQSFMEIKKASID